MNKMSLALISGVILGLLDGLSAIFAPGAQDMLEVIIISATIKGLINGGIVGVVSRRIDGIGVNVLIGGLVGSVLSVLAALPSGSYTEIVIPGTIIGLLLGFIVSKWGK